MADVVIVFVEAVIAETIYGEVAVLGAGGAGWQGKGGDRGGARGTLLWALLAGVQAGLEEAEKAGAVAAIVCSVG